MTNARLALIVFVVVWVLPSKVKLTPEGYHSDYRRLGGL